MKHVFGPVLSRRLGVSLGVDLVPFKVCSFDCVYCECGPTTVKTLVRDEYVSVKEVMSELDEFFSRNNDPIDHITFSGFGEPLLNERFKDVVLYIKRLKGDTPVALITNSSLLVESSIREEAGLCDVILPSLDAVSKDVFIKINNPCPEVDPDVIVEALKKFREEFPSVKMLLEVLFVKGFNDSMDELERLKEAFDYIDPDEIHINTVVRPPQADVEPVSDEFLFNAAIFFGNKARVVCKMYDAHKVNKLLILEAIRRRPMQLYELSKLTGSSSEELRDIIEEFEKEGLVEVVNFKGETFVRANK